MRGLPQVGQVSGPPTPKGGTAGDAGCTGTGVGFGEIVTAVRTIPQWSQTSSAEFTGCLQFGHRLGPPAVGFETADEDTLGAAANVGDAMVDESTAPQFSQMSSVGATI